MGFSSFPGTVLETPLFPAFSYIMHSSTDMVKLLLLYFLSDIKSQTRRFRGILFEGVVIFTQLIDS